MDIKNRAIDEAEKLLLDMALDEVDSLFAEMIGKWEFFDFSNPVMEYVRELNEKGKFEVGDEVLSPAAVRLYKKIQNCL